MEKVRESEAPAPPALVLALPELVMRILATVQYCAVYEHVLHLKWPP